MARNVRTKQTLAQQAEMEAAAVELEEFLTTHVANANPHSVYALDTDLTTHSGAADPHTVYVLEGATPGGELGNTYASPTVDTTHSGSSHASIQSAAEATAAAALTAHSVGTASITGAVAIANTETVVASATVASGLVAGSTFSVKGYGRLTSGAAGGSSIFRFRIGPTTLTGNIAATLTIANAALVTDAPFKLEILVTVRTNGATGTVIGNIAVNGGVTGAFTAVADVSANASTVVVDTTVSNLIEFTYVSGNAGTTTTFENVEISRVK